MPGTRPIGIYYEHPDWFWLLFAELDRRGTPYVRIPAERHSDDASNGSVNRYGLVFNRMSPIRVPAGPQRQHPLYVELPRTPRAARGARRQRIIRVPGRDLEGAAAVAVAFAGPAVPGGCTRPRARP